MESKVDDNIIDSDYNNLIDTYILKNNDLNISNNNININIDKNISLEPNLLLDSIISSKLADEEIVSSTLESVAIKNNLQDNDSDYEYATPNITPSTTSANLRTFESEKNIHFPISRSYSSTTSSLLSPKQSASNFPIKSKSLDISKLATEKLSNSDPHPNKLHCKPISSNLLTSRQVEQNELLNGLLSSRVKLSLQTPPADTTISLVNLNPYSNNNPTFKAPLSSREEPNYYKLTSNLKPSFAISRAKSNKCSDNQYYSFDVNVNSCDIPTVEKTNTAPKLIKKSSAPLPRPKSANVVQSYKELLKNYKNTKELAPKKTVLKSNIIQLEL